MTNIHIYPSTFTHESRIFREVTAIGSMNLFDRLVLVGVKATTLPAVQALAPGIEIRRLGPGKAGGGIVKIVQHLLWCANVLKFSLRSRPVCVNCHSLPVLPLGALVKLFTGAKLIYDAHELETETNGLHGVRKRLSKFLERALIGYCDHSIFVGEAIQDWYRSEYGLENSDVVYNCPVEKSVQDGDYFREKFDIAPDTKIFLYLGVLSPGRGIEVLLQVFSRIDGAAIVFMGYGNYERIIADASEGSSSIFLHQAVPPQDLLQLAATADYGLSLIEPVSLSYEYSMPNKIFEYIMAGKPILVAPTREQKNLVERFGIGVVAKSLKHEDVRAAVVDLISRDPTEFDEGLEQAKKRYNWAAQEETLSRIYRTRLGFTTRNQQAEA